MIRLSQMEFVAAADREIIRSLAKQHHVSSVKLFGSQVTGHATDSSDIDLLVKFTKTASLIQIIGFKQAIEEALSRKVDVVEEGGISRFLRDRILAEAQPL